MTDIVPSSTQGKALENVIQSQLIHHGWAAEGDAVMAEYCVVMLSNRKTADQIESELSDLIGSDFEPSFVTWLFQQRDKFYPDPAASSNPSATSPTAHHDQTSASSTTAAVNSASSYNNNAGDQQHQQRQDRTRGQQQGPGGRAVFGAALSGMKRDARDLDGPNSQPSPQQRPRIDNNGGPRGQFARIPSGPRNQNGLPAGPPRGASEGGKSIFERVQQGPIRQRNHQQPNANALGMPQAAFDAISQAIHAVNNGAHPSALAAIPFPALAAHPHSAFLPPQVLAQAQAAAMAQAQAFAAMQNVWAGAPAGPAPGFNAGAPPFMPGRGGPAGNFGPGGMPPRGGPRPPPHQQNPSTAPAATAPAPVVLPSKPEKEDICKHGVDCARPPCPFSHPSPAATKESGLVLSSEACDTQLKCEDPDCPKSHVSRAQKTAAGSSAISTSANGQQTYTPSTPAPRAPPVSDPMSTIPGAGEKLCKFAGSCTRKGCVFLHPWDVRGDPANPGGQVPCHWGAACTRADCHFAHPPNRPAPYSKQSGGGGPKSGSKYSATFNTPNKTGTSSSETKIGAWPKEAPTHVSERLKRFATAGDDAAGGGGGGEKIIPGAASAANGHGQTSGKDGNNDKVEIEVDDDPSSPVAPH